MEKKAGLGSVKRFGVRYGRTTKFNLAQIEIPQRKLQKCPYCHKTKAKRAFAGVYECSVCKSKFTGKAYFLEQKVRVEEMPAEIIVEEPAQVEEEVE